MLLYCHNVNFRTSACLFMVQLTCSTWRENTCHGDASAKRHPYAFQVRCQALIDPKFKFVAPIGVYIQPDTVLGNFGRTFELKEWVCFP